MRCTHALRAGPGAAATAGFTLLELLVALVVLGFILAGLAGGTRFGLRAAKSQARLSAGRGELDAVDRTLRTIVTEADPTARLQGTAGTMALVSGLPEGAGLGGGTADIGFGLDGSHRFVLRWTPHPPGSAARPAPSPQQVVLLEGISGVRCSYWSTSGAAGWTDAWDQPTLPALVRLRIVFPTGDPRHWPDIVAAPMRVAEATR